ncbi:hypothetical protein BDQ12DRAFT_729835 [Crucibulum laeve]|uniref:Uncharacterized protein n=1 Tax=Crucibulum laeve TaxID=68775 RepID=A0A5C3LEH4_9AGAR|nr:hypothetical protein BDQ12DRAFT_729835 [Crucibulum laeve]
MSSSQHPASNVPEEDEFAEAMHQVQAEAVAKLAAIVEKKKAVDEAKKRAEEERVAQEEAERRKAKVEKAEKERRKKEAAEAAEMDVDEDEDEDELAEVVQHREERSRTMQNTALPRRRKLKEVDEEQKKLEESIYRGMQWFPKRPASDLHCVDSDSEEEVGPSRRVRVESGSLESQALLAMTWETMAFMQESMAAFRDLAREMHGAVCEICSAVHHLGQDLHDVLQDHTDTQLWNAEVQEAMTKVMESISLEMWINCKRAELWKKREREVRATAAQQAVEKSGEDVEMGAEGVENEEGSVKKGSEGTESGDKEVGSKQEGVEQEVENGQGNAEMVDKEMENDVREDGGAEKGGEVEESQTLQD